MKKTYITPAVRIHELEPLCTTMLTGSKGEDTTTPGNDTRIPGTEGPGFGGDEGEDTDPA